MKLFAPEIGRLPVVPALYARAPKGYPNPFVMKLGGVDFDGKLSSARRNVVNSLFDHVITFRHAELKAAWGAIHAGEAQVARAQAAGKNVEAAQAALAEARKLASTVPMDARQAGDKATNDAFKDKPDVKSRLETEWDTAAKVSYARAKDLAASAPSRIR
jgi:hypothetical protein